MPELHKNDAAEELWGPEHHYYQRAHLIGKLFCVCVSLMRDTKEYHLIYLVMEPIQYFHYEVSPCHLIM